MLQCCNVAMARPPKDGRRTGDQLQKESCSARPWYQMGTTCEDPAKVLCPTFFQGTEGLGTFQVYGDPSAGVVVSQDVATWQLCQCLDDLSCDASTAEPRYLSTLGSAAIFLSSAALVFLSSLFN